MRHWINSNAMAIVIWTWRAHVRWFKAKDSTENCNFRYKLAMKWNYSIKTFIAIYLQSDGDASISSLNDWNWFNIWLRRLKKCEYYIIISRLWYFIICSIFTYCSQKNIKMNGKYIFNKALSSLLVYGAKMYDKIKV